MPPILALILCTIFVLFLLRLEHKQYPNASAALWIPTIWFLLETSKPLGILFGTGGATMEEGSALDRVVLLILFCLGFIVVVKRKYNIADSLKKNYWVTLFLIMSLFSVLWSDMPFVCFKRWFRMLIPLIMAFVIATEVDPFKAIQSLVRRTIYIHIPFSYILINYYPFWGRQYGRWSGALMWVGVSSQKNGLALLCMFAMFYFIWTYIRRRDGSETKVTGYQTYVEIFIFLLALWLFLGPNHTLTYSATSAVALILGLAILFLFKWLRKFNVIPGINVLTIIIIMIIIYGTATPFVGGLMVYDPSSTLGRDESLTGRTEIWSYLIPYALNRPILGHGFGGFWTDAMREATSSHAHNGYLHTILNIGFMGLFFLSMFLIANCQKARNLMTQDFNWGILWFCFLMISVIHNIAESSVTSISGLMPTILLFMMMSFTAKQEVSDKDVGLTRPLDPSSKV